MTPDTILSLLCKLNDTIDALQAENERLQAENERLTTEAEDDGA